MLEPRFTIVFIYLSKGPKSMSSSLRMVGSEFPSHSLRRSMLAGTLREGDCASLPKAGSHHVESSIPPIFLCGHSAGSLCRLACRCEDLQSG